MYPKQFILLNIVAGKFQRKESVNDLNYKRNYLNIPSKLLIEVKFESI